MTEVTTTEERPTHRNGRGLAPVNASALAAHLGCTRQYVARLTADGIIERRGEGYDQDASRLRYIAHLRSENRRSPRTKADAEHTAAKAELLRIKIAEKRKVLMMVTEHEAFVEMITGMFLTGLAGFAARCGGRDLAVRREIDRAIYDLRMEISVAATRLANDRGEPGNPP